MTSHEMEINVSDVKAVIPPEGQSQAGSEYQKSTFGENKFSLAIVILSLVIAIIAIIVAAVSITRIGGPGEVTNRDVTNSGSLKTSDDIWTFAIGHDGSNLEYIEDTSGTLRGFHVDIIDAVCSEAGKDCRLIWDVYENCWDSQAGQNPRAGKGLMGKWYDGCTGWFNTYERSLTVQFSAEFRQGLTNYFFVRTGNPGNFDPANIANNQKIGFIDGWAADEHCLARTGNIQGVPLMTSQILHYPTRDQLLVAVQDGEVDAAFANSNQFTSSELDTVGDVVTSCSLGGGSMMSRKDSTLNSWWNDAFRAIQNNGVYNRICNGAATDHGHRPGATGDLLCV